MIKRSCHAVFFILLLGAFSYAWTDTAGGDHGGADWAPTNGLKIGGAHTNIGTFTVGAGTGVVVSAGTPLEIYAKKIIVSGTIAGDFAGYSGGAGGATKGGSGAYSWGGIGGAEGGAGGSGVYAGYCGSEPCAARLGAGGGGGGGYGGKGAPGGKSGGDRDGGSGGGIRGDANSKAIEMGSGAGGGGAGGSCWHYGGNGGSNGTDGSASDAGCTVPETPPAGSGGPGGGGNGRGGGAVLLSATEITISGTITANGGGGGGGGVGNSASSSCSAGEGGGGGGGASGGGVLVMADNITFTGTIRAKGGPGGQGGRRVCDSSSYHKPGSAGGQGGGGRVKLFAESSLIATGSVDVSGYENGTYTKKLAKNVCLKGGGNCISGTTCAVEGMVEAGAEASCDGEQRCCCPSGNFWNVSLEKCQAAASWITTDAAPPVRSGSNYGFPSAVPTLYLNTDEPATCRYNTAPNIAYSSMPSSTTTALGTSHSWSLSGLSGGKQTFNLRCSDPAGNANADDVTISFDYVSNSPCPPYGDVNGDGAVTFADSFEITAYAVGITTLSAGAMANADVNEDDSVDSTDSLFIAQYVIGLRDIFPVCKHAGDVCTKGGGTCIDIESGCESDGLVEAGAEASCVGEQRCCCPSGTSWNATALKCQPAASSSILPPTSTTGPVKIMSACGDTPVVTLSSYLIGEGSAVAATVSGLSSCDGRTVSVRENGCGGSEIGTCSVSGSGCTVPSTYPAFGQYFFYACIDKNGDGSYTEGEIGVSGLLEVESAPASVPMLGPPGPSKGPTGSKSYVKAEISVGCASGQCTIAGACYNIGQDNPSNSCQKCDLSNLNSWSNKACGASCSGGVCVSGSCQSTASRCADGCALVSSGSACPSGGSCMCAGASCTCRTVGSDGVTATVPVSVSHAPNLLTVSGVVLVADGKEDCLAETCSLPGVEKCAQSGDWYYARFVPQEVPEGQKLDVQYVKHEGCADSDYTVGTISYILKV